MKKIVNLFLLIISLFLMSIKNVNAIVPQNGEGGFYYIDTRCVAYPEMKINITDPNSSSNLSNAYCVELGVAYVEPWTSLNFQLCEKYDSLPCNKKEAAYLGIVRGKTDFWAAQSILNGRTFYKYNNCSGDAISTESLLREAEEYCTAPTLNSVTVTEGQTLNLNLPELIDYQVESSSSNLSVIKNDSNVSIIALSSGNGHILFSKGSKESIKGFCRENYTNSSGKEAGQDLMVPLAPPYVSVNLLVNVTNIIRYGSLTIIKSGAEDSEIRIPNVQFKVCTNEEMTSDCQTYITDSNGTFTTNEFAVGTDLYYQELSAPEDYKIDENVYSFRINNEGVNEKIVTNGLKHYYLKIFKLSKDLKETISNVKINIYKKDGTLYKEVVTDSNGEAQTELEIGEYYFEEPETPTGYEKINGKLNFINKSTNEETNEFVLTSESEEYTEITIYNTFINAKTGRISIIIPLAIVLLCIPIVFMYIVKHQKLI